MKTTTFFALSAALFGLAAAAPVHKRDIIVQTVTSEVVTTVEVTTTVWVDPPTSTPSPDVEPAEFFESPSPTPEEEAPAPSSSSSEAAPSVPSSTEVPLAPAPATTTQAPAPVVETLAPVAESPAPVIESPAPVVESPAPEVQQPSPQPEQEQTEAPSTGGGSGQYSGDLTHYTPGMGSCGFTNGESDWIVAVSKELFDRTTPNGNPNNNPICGKSINIFYGGQSFTAKVADRCAGCAKEGDLDMPQAMFDAVTGGKGDGRVTEGMSWSFA